MNRKVLIFLMAFSQLSPQICSAAQRTPTPQLSVEKEKGNWVLLVRSNSQNPINRKAPNQLEWRGTRKPRPSNPPTEYSETLVFDLSGPPGPQPAKMNLYICDSTRNICERQKLEFNLDPVTQLLTAPIRK